MIDDPANSYLRIPIKRNNSEARTERSKMFFSRIPSQEKVHTKNCCSGIVFHPHKQVVPVKVYFLLCLSLSRITSGSNLLHRLCQITRLLFGEGL
ncbi:hypothetical protein CEXT_377761 [Caerostris extrusa]|uniref:Ycf15 n=1 Tax=Caerostris extrusa TaxID=172846 RepID=A0AAV4S5Q8_CAEEX|nr:hypothetical protein CEXT_377761 [Caerostris extrusa]